MNRYLILIAFASLTLAVGCGESSDPPAPEQNLDGAYVLGLTRDHQLFYEIYDSTVIISLDDDDTVLYDTSNLIVEIIRGQNNRVELAINGAPHDLLTIDDIGILHSGQIRPDIIPPDTIFFYPTPIIMPRSFSVGSSWNIESPPYTIASGEIKRTLLYLNYGYYTERHYLGRELVVLPSGSFDAYYFQSFIFADMASSDTLIRTEEYHAPGVGLVKLVARYNHSQRLIILLEDS